MEYVFKKMDFFMQGDKKPLFILFNSLNKLIKFFISKTTGRISLFGLLRHCF